MDDTEWAKPAVGRASIRHMTRDATATTTPKFLASEAATQHPNAPRDFYVWDRQSGVRLHGPFADYETAAAIVRVIMASSGVGEHIGVLADRRRS